MFASLLVIAASVSSIVMGQVEPKPTPTLASLSEGETVEAAFSYTGRRRIPDIEFKFKRKDKQLVVWVGTIWFEKTYSLDGEITLTEEDVQKLDATISDLRSRSVAPKPPSVWPHFRFTHFRGADVISTEKLYGDLYVDIETSRRADRLTFSNLYARMKELASTHGPFKPTPAFSSLPVGEIIAVERSTRGHGIGWTQDRFWFERRGTQLVLMANVYDDKSNAMKEIKLVLEKDDVRRLDATLIDMRSKQETEARGEDSYRLFGRTSRHGYQLFHFRGTKKVGQEYLLRLLSEDSDVMSNLMDRLMKQRL